MRIRFLTTANKPPWRSRCNSTDAILIDEENGRAVAEQLGLTRIGILGVLLKAKANGLIRGIAPILESLRQDAGFWMSDALRREVLQLAGETP